MHLIAKTYQDLLDEIQYYVARIFQLKTERKILLSKMSGMPQGYKSNSRMDLSGVRGSNNFISLEEACTRIEQINELLRDCEHMMSLLQEQLGEINILLYNLEGRPYKIFYLHKCENKSFKEIAEIVGLSVSQVQRIYKEVIKDE